MNFNPTRIKSPDRYHVIIMSSKVLQLSTRCFAQRFRLNKVTINDTLSCFRHAPFPPIMFKSALKKVNGQLFMVHIVKTKFCTLSAALMLSGSSFQRRGA